MNRNRRVVAIAVAGFVLFCLTLLNCRLYAPDRTETSLAQLRFLKQSLAHGGAERMQSIFPEGYVFTWALYGLTSAQVARALPSADARRGEALRAAREAVARVDSDPARATFVADQAPAYGAFYASWSLYLRSCVLRATRNGDPAPFNLARYREDCDSLAAALARSDTPYLPSYPEQAWPADTAVGVAALAIADSIFGGEYRATIDRWVEVVRRRMDPKYGAIPHAANSRDGSPLGGPRGESLALLSLVLVDVDRALAREQYEILRRNFVDYTWGLPGVREYPQGMNGRGDVDSGPILLGFSGPATVVGVGAALAHGDEELATTLLGAAELAGLPIEVAGRRRYLGGFLPVGDAFLAWARSSAPSPVRVAYPPVIPRWWRVPIHLVSILIGFLIVRAKRRP